MNRVQVEKLRSVLLAVALLVSVLPGAASPQEREVRKPQFEVLSKSPTPTAVAAPSLEPFEAFARTLSSKVTADQARAVDAASAAVLDRLVRKSETGDPEALAKEALDNIFAGAGIINGNIDIESLVFLVMMEAARAEEEDLKNIMEELQKINAEKKKLRDLLTAARAHAQAERVVLRDQAQSPERAVRVPAQATTPIPDRKAAGTLRLPTITYTPESIRTLRGDDLQNAYDTIVVSLDSTNELSEEKSLHLQIARDRRSRIIQTLSNVMKKISKTQEGISQNSK